MNKLHRQMLSIIFKLYVEAEMKLGQVAIKIFLREVITRRSGNGKRELKSYRNVS